jgi:hypothetical protein
MARRRRSHIRARPRRRGGKGRIAGLADPCAPRAGVAE